MNFPEEVPLGMRFRWNIPMYVERYINLDEIDNHIIGIGQRPKSKVIVTKVRNDFRGFYHPWFRIDHNDERLVSIKPSLYAAICESEQVRHLLIPQRDFPELVELFLEFRQSSNIGVRIDRYMALYKTYETLTHNRDIEFSAIRHSLSHSKRNLSHKLTLEKLNEFFEGSEINFEKYKHRKIFYIQMTKLYKEVDRLLYEMIKPLLSNTKKCFKTLEMILPQPNTKQIPLDSITKS